MSDIHIFYRRVEYELRAIFVDGVIGEVHELIIQIIRSRHFVFLSGKSS